MALCSSDRAATQVAGTYFMTRFIFKCKTLSTHVTITMSFLHVYLKQDKALRVSLAKLFQM